MEYLVSKTNSSSNNNLVKRFGNKYSRMSPKFTFSLLLILFVSTVKTQQSEEQSIINDIEKLLQKLRKLVDDSLVKAQKTLDEAKEKISQMAQKTENSAKIAMQHIEETVQVDLDAIKEKANETGVNIDTCLGEDEMKLINLPNEFSDDMVHCISDKINRSSRFAQDALNRIKTIVSDIENIKKEIKDCGHGVKSVTCLAKLALKIDGEIISLPKHIEKDAIATALMITQLGKKVEKCASEKTKACESQGKVLIEKIKNCVSSKIIDH